MSLRDLESLHARGILTDPSHHGEQVVYHPADGSGSRPVRAVVERLDREPANELAPQIQKLRATLLVPRHEEDGVLLFDPAGRFEVAMRIGEAARMATIVRLIAQTEGAFRIEVEA